MQRLPVMSPAQVTATAAALLLLVCTSLLASSCAAATHPDNSQQARRLLQAAPAVKDDSDWDWQLKDNNCLVTKPETRCPPNLPLPGCCNAAEGVCRGFNDVGADCWNDWEPACCANPADGK
jgi:hypothetical protein